MVDLHGIDQITELLLAGGSGHGNPLDRPYQAVQRDLDGEYVTVEGAERDYGCIVATDGLIDIAASDCLRDARRGVSEFAQ